MYARKDRKDDEDAATGGNKWSGERSSVLQEARVFNKSPLDPKKCSQVSLLDAGNNSTATRVLRAVSNIDETRRFTARNRSRRGPPTSLVVRLDFSLTKSPDKKDSEP